MKRFDFLNFALENGSGKIEIPNEILILILKFENHVNKEIENFNMRCVINWVSVEEKLPELDTEVLIVTKDGYVGYGQRSEQLIVERGKNKIYRQTDKKQIEWGIQENGGEYWHKLENVVLWADFPKPPHFITG